MACIQSPKRIYIATIEFYHNSLNDHRIMSVNGFAYIDRMSYLQQKQLPIINIIRPSGRGLFWAKDWS